jgi:hypothetical protein
MWQTKTFRTAQAMRQWVAPREHRIQWVEVYINNGYAIEWRPLRFIG